MPARKKKDQNVNPSDVPEKGVKSGRSSRSRGAEAQSAEAEAPEPAESATRPVTSLWPGILKYRNNPSGKEYVWEAAGDVVMVDVLDLDVLRARNDPEEQQRCCGVKGTHRKLQVPES